MCSKYWILILMCLTGMMGCEKPDTKKRTVIQEITVITPPPPPPPPPEEVIEPEVEEIIEEELEEPTPDEAPPEAASQDLGVDAEGGAGSDSFGLIGKKGGQGLLSSGGYSAYMRSELQKAVMQQQKLRRFEYKALIKVWFDAVGKITNTEVVLLEGKSEAKKELEIFMKKFPEMIKNKPLEAEENYYELRVSSLF